MGHKGTTARCRRFAASLSMNGISHLIQLIITVLILSRQIPVICDKIMFYSFSVYRSVSHVAKKFVTGRDKWHGIVIAI